MKRNRILLHSAACMILTAALFTACGHPADEDAIALPDPLEQLLAQANDTSSGRQRLSSVRESSPEEFSCSLSWNDGQFRLLSYSSPLIFPDAEAIPVCRVSAGYYFTEEMLAKLCEFLFGSETVYSDLTPTRAELETEIVAMEELTARLEANPNLTQETRASLTERIQTALNSKKAGLLSAPAVDPGRREIDLSALSFAENGGLHISLRTPGGKTLTVSNESDTEWIPSGLSYLYERPTVSYDIRNVSGAGGEPATSGGSFASDRALTADEAAGTVERFLEAAGIRARERRTVPITNLYTGEETGYLLSYAPEVYGIPAACSTNSSFRSELPVWFYQPLQFVVDKDGIVQISWSNPESAGEILAEDPCLISFDEASRIMEQAVSFSYEHSVSSFTQRGQRDLNSYRCQVLISGIRLEPIRIRDTSGTRNGLYVPAWVFCGEYLTQDPPGSDAFFPVDSPWIVCAVNAIDGSVIDIIDGY